MLDTVKISGIRVIPNRGIDRDTEVSMNICRDRVSDESEERIWAVSYTHLDVYKRQVSYVYFT